MNDTATTAPKKAAKKATKTPTKKAPAKAAKPAPKAKAPAKKAKATPVPKLSEKQVEVLKRAVATGAEGLPPTALDTRTVNSLQAKGLLKVTKKAVTATKAGAGLVSTAA